MRVLIVGGYGDVGRRIAAALASDVQLHLIVAGRDHRKARSLASQLGKRARALQLDVHDREAVVSAVADSDLIVCCVDQREPHLVSSAIEQGAAYLDVTAGWEFISRCLAMHEQAEAAGVHIWVGSGLSPGLVNVMARAATDQLREVDTVHSYLFLGMGDEAGPAALDFMLKAASEPFSVVEHGRSRIAWAFREARHIDVPSEEGRLCAYRFPMPDQFFFPQTLGVPTAASWLAFEPAWVNLAWIVLSRSRAIWLLRSKKMRRAIVRMLAWGENAFHGRDHVRLVVEARSADGSSYLTVSGRGQAHATAASALVMARMLLDGPATRPGVWLPEQVVDPSPFFRSLAELGWHVVRH